MSYLLDLDDIAWAKLETAYGSAECIPKLLNCILSEDEVIALKAAGELEGYLCHQQVQIHTGSAAALPFLLEALTKVSASVAEEILFVLWGYALATEDKFWRSKPNWVEPMTRSLNENIYLIGQFRNAESEDSTYYANEIISILSGTHENST